MLGEHGDEFSVGVLLSGGRQLPIGRIVGAEAPGFAGWRRLNVEYAKQLGLEPPRLGEGVQ